MDVIGTAVQSVKDFELAQKETAAANEKSSMKVLEAQQAALTADQIIETEKAKGIKAAEDAKQRIREAAGGEAALINQVQKVHDQTQKVAGITYEVVRARNRSIFDLFSDPIGTLKDIVTLPQKETALEGEVLKAQVAVKGAEDRHKSLTYGFQEAENTKTTVTAASLAALNQKYDAARAEAAAKAEIAGRSFGLQAIQAGLQSTEAQIKYLENGRNAVKLEQSMKIQLDQFKLAQQSAARDATRLAMALRAEARDAAKQAEADAEVAQYGQWLRAGAATLGVTMGTNPTDIKMALRRAQNPDTQEALMLRIGMGNSKTGTTSRIAANPSDAVEILSKYDIPFNESMKPALDILKRAKDLVDKNPDPTKRIDRKKDPAGWSMEFDSKVRDLVTQEYAQVTPKGLLDLSPVLGSYVQNSPALQNLAFTQKVLKPLMQTNQFPQDHQALIKIGISEMQKGNITSDQLLNGVTAIYTQASQVHAAQLRLTDFGIVPPKGGVQYNVKTDIGVTPKVVDLTKADDVRQLIKDAISPRQVIGTRLTNPFMLN